jgi:hypothetical protein
MRRLTIVLGIALLATGLAFAETRTLIDFSELMGDIQVGDEMQHSATMVDFSDQAGASYTDEEKDEMRISLAMEEWDVELASSSQTVGNMRDSYTKAVPSKTFGTVLGARIRFPTGSYNSWAIIKPPFEIPAYAWPTKVEDGEVVELTPEEIQQSNDSSGASQGEAGYVTKTSKYDGLGVIKNVATLKSMKVQAYGSNFPHGFAIRVKDQNGNTNDIFMGYLNFDGWKEIQWENPNYIDEVRNRELRLLPLYPQADPYLKLMGIIVYRDGAAMGGDFVTYFKDIEVTFDKAVLSLDRDIDDEEAWGILADREEARRAAENRRLGNLQVLRFLEGKKQHREIEEGSSE